MRTRGQVGVNIVRILLTTLALWMLATLGATWLVIDEPMPRADALLVMAGGEVYLERVQHAAELFREGTAARILLTDDGQKHSWSRPLQRNPGSTELAIDVLQRVGVPRDRIEILPGIVHGTSDEAVAVKRYADEHPLRSLVAVTSPYHTRRTAWTLRHILRNDGIAIGIDPVPATRTTPKPATWWASLDGWRTVATEFVKLPYYWLRFGALGSVAD